MKREDWKKVEDLVNSGRSALLRIEGRIITLRLERIKMRLVVGVYVDDTVKLAWCLKESEHDESRFMCRQQCYVYSAKFRKMWASTDRKLSGLKLRVLNPFTIPAEINAKRTRLVPWFPSVTKVRTQYEKTFSSIELVDA